MGNGASAAAQQRMIPRRVKIFLDGRPDVKLRVAVPPTWPEFCAVVQQKLGIPLSRHIKVTADGVECHALEEIDEGELLCISLETEADIARSDSGGRRVFSAQLSRTVAQDFTTYAILGTARASDFTVVEAVAGGHNGFVFKSRCTLGGLPDPNALLALKMVYNFGVEAAEASRAFANEFRVLSQLAPQQNITRFWCQFVDKIPDVILPALPEFAREQANYQEHPGGPTVRRQAQFLVMDYHPNSLRSVRSRLPTPLPLKLFCNYACDLLSAVSHLDMHSMCHLDLKDDNVLVSAAGHLCLCDFGTAVRFPTREMVLQYTPGMSPGGNQQHLAPEVLNEYMRLERTSASTGSLNYSGQSAFAAGVMLYELVMGRAPWPSYPDECRSGGDIEYDVNKLTGFGDTYPDWLFELVKAMMQCNPRHRPSVQAVLSQVQALKKGPVVALADLSAAQTAMAGLGAGGITPSYGRRAATPTSTSPGPASPSHGSTASHVDDLADEPVPFFPGTPPRDSPSFGGRASNEEPSAELEGAGEPEPAALDRPATSQRQLRVPASRRGNMLAGMLDSPSPSEAKGSDPVGFPTPGDSGTPAGRSGRDGSPGRAGAGTAEGRGLSRRASRYRQDGEGDREGKASSGATSPRLRRRSSRYRAEDGGGGANGKGVGSSAALDGGAGRRVSPIASAVGGRQRPAAGAMPVRSPLGGGGRGRSPGGSLGGGGRVRSALPPIGGAGTGGRARSLAPAALGAVGQLGGDEDDGVAALGSGGDPDALSPAHASPTRAGRRSLNRSPLLLDDSLQEFVGAASTAGSTTSGGGGGGGARRGLAVSGSGAGSSRRGSLSSTASGGAVTGSVGGRSPMSTSLGLAGGIAAGVRPGSSSGGRGQAPAPAAGATAATTSFADGAIGSLLEELNGDRVGAGPGAARPALAGAAAAHLRRGRPSGPAAADHQVALTNGGRRRGSYRAPDFDLDF